MNDDFERRCRLALASQSDTLDLVKEFTAMDFERRRACWTQMFKGGTDDLEFAKFVHRHFAWLVLEVFGSPEAKKVT